MCGGSAPFATPIASGPRITITIMVMSTHHKQKQEEEGEGGMVMMAVG
jgi:small neutral amino acid transporter SnatA (MarC family)